MGHHQLAVVPHEQVDRLPLMRVGGVLRLQPSCLAVGLGGLAQTLAEDLLIAPEEEVQHVKERPSWP